MTGYAAMLALALVAAACGDDAKKPASSSADAPAGAPGSSAPKPAAGSSAFMGLDTTDGTLTVVAGLPGKGTWTMKDVTAYLDEHARAGSTIYEFSLEGHDGDAGNHLRLRLLREGSAIDAGTYTIGGTDRKLEARWEHNGSTYSSRVGGKGSVQLRAIDAAHAEGSFDVGLAQFDQDGGLQQVSGTFNQKLNK